jgi:hypothetical protein
MRRFDQMRTALAHCTFLPGSPPKRFARQVSQMPLENITEGQRRHVIRLAYRYRRQMPRDLVPSKDAVEALDAAWNAKRQEQMAAPRVTRRQAKSNAQPSLLDFIGGMHA